MLLVQPTISREGGEAEMPSAEHAQPCNPPVGEFNRDASQLGRRLPPHPAAVRAHRLWSPPSSE